jgi:hypothetical protein
MRPCLRARCTPLAGGRSQATLTPPRAEAEALGSRRSLWAILAALADLAAAQGETAAPCLAPRGGGSYLLAAGSDDLHASFRTRPAVRAVLSAAA